MKKLLLATMLTTTLHAGGVTLLSERHWQGKYEPSPPVSVIQPWGLDVKAATSATVGDAFLNQLIFGWAIFRIHVKSGWDDFKCTITKSVCMENNDICENLTQNYLFNEGGVLDDDKSYRAGNTYKTLGTHLTSSHVYMDRCGGSWYDAHAVGAVLVKPK